MRLKQLFILFFINLFCIYSPSHAMAEFTERMLMLNISQTGPNYFTSLPPEIQNEISQYLTFNDKEDDLEFVDRTKAIPQGSERVAIHYRGWEIKSCTTGFFYRKSFMQATYKALKINKVFESLRLPKIIPYIKSKIFSCSPDMKKIVFSHCNGYKVIDLETENVIGPLLEKTRTYEIKAISVSPIDNRVALVEKTSLVSLAEARKECAKAKIFDGDKRFMSLSTQIPTDQVKSIAFNKQGTKIIVHGADSYQIIPLVDETTHREKTEKTLADYFRQKGVCKELQQQTTKK